MRRLDSTLRHAEWGPSGSVIPVDLMERILNEEEELPPGFEHFGVQVRILRRVEGAVISAIDECIQTEIASTRSLEDSMNNLIEHLYTEVETALDEVRYDPQFNKEVSDASKLYDSIRDKSLLGIEVAFQIFRSLVDHHKNEASPLSREEIDVDDAVIAAQELSVRLQSLSGKVAGKIEETLGINLGTDVRFIPALEINAQGEYDITSEIATEITTILPAEIREFVNPKSCPGRATKVVKHLLNSLGRLAKDKQAKSLF